MDLVAAVNASIAQLATRIRRLEALPRGHIPADAVLFDHFAGDGTLDARWTTGGVGGTVTLPNATPTYVRLSTGALANQSASMDWGARQALVGMAAAAWLRWRGRMTTAIDAATINLVQFRGPTAFTQLEIGILGSSSVAFFVARSIEPGGPTTTMTITTVPIDTAWHEFFIQTMPDRVRYWIDNALVAEHVSGVVALPLAIALMPRAEVNNGATAADRQMDIDWIGVDEAAV